MVDNNSKLMNQERGCSVREAVLGDYEAIRQVELRNGLRSKSYSDWARLRTDNPFHDELQVPMGWVLESKTQGVVGTFSNIPRIYSLNGKPVRAAVASVWAVDRQFRFATTLLVEKYFSQRNIDLYLVTTAIPPTRARFIAFNGKDVPCPSCTQISFWIRNYAGFAGALMRKAGAPALGGIKHAAGMVLYCKDLLHRPEGKFLRKQISLLPCFDERFDAIWDVLSRRRDRLMAVRTRDALNWQFRSAMESGDIVILGLMEGDSLGGYLIMKRYDQLRVGLRRFRVVDIQAVRDEANTILSLMSAALEHAARSGVDVLEATGFHKSKYDLLQRLKPHQRNLSSCMYLYRMGENSQTLQDALQDADAWDPSPFDGDSSL